MEEPRTMDPAPPDPAVGDARRRLERVIGATRLALYWERLWPRLALALGIAGLFAALAWLGVFARLPDVPRLGLAAAFALAAAAAAGRAALTPPPGRRAALARLESDSRLRHHPLTALLDVQDLGGDDPASRGLWRAHRRRLAVAVAGLRPPRPAPRLDRADAYGLRVAVLMLAIVGWTAVGDHCHPIAAAFRLPAPTAAEAGVYAWITPPAYTGLAPRALPDADAPDAPVRVPEGSRLTIRLSGVADPAVLLTAGNGAPVALAPADGAGERHAAFQTTITAGDRLEIRAGRRALRRWRLDVIADRPPTIALVGEPAATAEGALALSYRAEDDYRLAAVRAQFAPIAPSRSDRPAPRPLVGLPEVALALPARGSGGMAETIRDLSAHPRAGERVSMRLAAADDAGHTARAPTVEIVLPTRPFVNPLAAMLVAERRRLAADAGAAGSVAQTVETASQLGAGFIGRAGPIIALRVISQSLRHARGDDDLRAALDLMWTVAIGLESGDAADAGERLREARAALREALARNAPTEEIARLADALAAALDAYMAALAEELRRNPDRLADLAAPPPPNGRALSPDDLK